MGETIVLPLPIRNTGLGGYRPYVIGPATAALPFAERLAAREWLERSHAERVVGEYKRSASSACDAGHKVTRPRGRQPGIPSTYSRITAAILPEVLGRDLHHEPTLGGAGQQHHSSSNMPRR